MRLTHMQREHLIERGYVKIPGAVPDIMVREAMKAINHSIGQGIPAGHRGANYCRELENRPVITDLFNRTPIKSIVDSLIGEEAYYSIGAGQIALRFPDYADNPPDDLGAHLDGVLRVKEGIAQNFTALVGVMLSDQTEPDRGNFKVYPGTHRDYEAFFREHGPEALLTDEGIRQRHRSDRVPLPKGVQITGEPGDLIITHYQLVHAGGVNQSDRIRCSVYFRVDHKDRRNDWRAPLVDLWRHWPGVRTAIPE
ncbi:phytanoyl-CoA dioxygenase family protein [Paenibacillus sp. GCM10023250]|uniref:phytanoyl-CoA dioxygenase family protein n=1 Tax=Paenibacillus sp. GCM10023250 TaxID=3252648 RepID=UPI0036217A87